MMTRNTRLLAPVRKTQLLGGPEAPQQEETQPPGPESPTTKGHQAAERAPIAEVNVLHTLVKEYKARDDQNSRLQKRNFWLGVITAAIVFAYTTVATLQWCTTREANQIAREALVASDRPWVGITVVEVPSKPVGGMPFGVRIAVRNSGRSPAIRAFGKKVLRPLIHPVGDQRIPFVEDLDLTACFGHKPQWGENPDGTIILPGVEAVNLEVQSPALDERVVKLVTGQVKTMDVQLDELQGIDRATTLPVTDLWEVRIYLVGCFVYFDGQHQAHRTTFCQYYTTSSLDPSANGAFSACVRGNEAD